MKYIFLFFLIINTTAFCLPAEQNNINLRSTASIDWTERLNTILETLPAEITPPTSTETTLSTSEYLPLNISLEETQTCIDSLSLEQIQKCKNLKKTYQDKNTITKILPLPLLTGIIIELFYHCRKNVVFIKNKPENAFDTETLLLLQDTAYWLLDEVIKNGKSMINEINTLNPEIKKLTNKERRQRGGKKINELEEETKKSVLDKKNEITAKTNQMNNSILILQHLHTITKNNALKMHLAPSTIYSMLFHALIEFIIEIEKKYCPTDHFFQNSTLINEFHINAIDIFVDKEDKKMGGGHFFHNNPVPAISRNATSLHAMLTKNTPSAYPICKLTNTTAAETWSHIRIGTWGVFQPDNENGFHYKLSSLWPEIYKEKLPNLLETIIHVSNDANDTTIFYNKTTKKTQHSKLNEMLYYNYEKTTPVVCLYTENQPINQMTIIKSAYPLYPIFITKKDLANSDHAQSILEKIETPLISHLELLFIIKKIKNKIIKIIDYAKQNSHSETISSENLLHAALSRYLSTISESKITLTPQRISFLLTQELQDISQEFKYLSLSIFNKIEKTLKQKPLTIKNLKPNKTPTEPDATTAKAETTADEPKATNDEPDTLQEFITQITQEIVTYLNKEPAAASSSKKSWEHKKRLFYKKNNLKLVPLSNTPQGITGKKSTYFINYGNVGSEVANKDPNTLNPEKLKTPFIQEKALWHLFKEKLSDQKRYPWNIKTNSLTAQ